MSYISNCSELIPRISSDLTVYSFQELGLINLFLFLFYLCDVFQPSSQSDEHKEHGWSVEKGHRALAGLLRHGHDEDNAGIDVGNGGG